MSGEQRCSICRKGSRHNVTLYRVTPKGESPAEYRCGDHRSAEVLQQVSEGS